jgi:hypothetical protein
MNGRGGPAEDADQRGGWSALLLMGLRGAWRDYAVRRKAWRFLRTLRELPLDAPALGETWYALERWLEMSPRHQAIWADVEREWQEAHEKSARVRAGRCNCEFCQARAADRRAP